MVSFLQFGSGGTSGSSVNKSSFMELLTDSVSVSACSLVSSNKHISASLASDCPKSERADLSPFGAGDVFLVERNGHFNGELRESFPCRQRVLPFDNGLRNGDFLFEELLTCIFRFCGPASCQKRVT